MLPDRERSKNRENIVNETKNMEYVKVLIPFFFFFSSFVSFTVVDLKSSLSRAQVSRLPCFKIGICFSFH